MFIQEEVAEKLSFDDLNCNLVWTTDQHILFHNTHFIMERQ